MVKHFKSSFISIQIKYKITLLHKWIFKENIKMHILIQKHSQIFTDLNLMDRNKIYFFPWIVFESKWKYNS